MKNTKQVNKCTMLALLAFIVFSSFINPASAAYSFKTPTNTARIVEHDVQFHPQTRSYVILYVHAFKSTSNAYFQYRIIDSGDEWGRYFIVYFKAEGSSTWVQKNNKVYGSSFTSSKFSLGAMSANANYQIKIEIYFGGYADNYHLEWAEVDECNVGLLKIETPEGDFVLENACADKYLNMGMAGTQIKLTTKIIAPPHFIYGTTNGLEKYILNVWTEAKCTKTGGFFNNMKFYVKELKYTVSIRMYDNSAGDLSGISCNSIKTAHSSEVTYNTIDWTLSASVTGTYGSVGASFSLKRGDDLTHHDKSTSSSGSGVGNWRQIGYVHYKLNTGANREIASDFQLVAPGYIMGYLHGHNIQIKIDVWSSSYLWNTWFGGSWGKSHIDCSYSFIIGDGHDDTYDNPISYADTFITCIPGSLDWSY
jgi:hypothetical protein